MAKLSVNVNKLATLRNARGKNNPNVVAMTLDIISYGAHGVTVHPRPDERHITLKDVYSLAEAIDVEFNLEGYPDERFLSLVKDIKPAQCTLVPDPPHVLTSNAGWNIANNLDLLCQTVEDLHKYDIRTSLFVDPYTLNKNDINLIRQTETDRVELYTEDYAEKFHLKQAVESIHIYKNIADMLTAAGIGLNAGHDLDLENLPTFINAIPNILEVSIGHALICDALYLGMQETIKRYVQAAYHA